LEPREESFPCLFGYFEYSRDVRGLFETLNSSTSLFEVFLRFFSILPMGEEDLEPSFFMPNFLIYSRVSSAELSSLFVPDYALLILYLSSFLPTWFLLFLFRVMFCSIRFDYFMIRWLGMEFDRLS
jgi:hypothetical protein